MNAKLFSGAFAKIKRTEPQIDDLNSRITAYFSTKPCEVVSKVNSDGTEEVWSVRLGDTLPDEFAVIVGEILYNLRSCLDQIACDLAIAHSGSSTNTYFPFGRDANALETEIINKTKKLPPDAVALIRTTKPYKGGNNLLWAIHDLNRRDKHLSLLPVGILSVAELSEIIVFSGQVLVLGSRRGRHMVRFPGGMTQDDPGKQPRIRISAGGEPYTEFIALPDTDTGTDFEFLVCTPGTKFDTDFKPVLNIAISEVFDGIESEPVVALLNQMRQLVNGISLAFRDRFS